MNLTDKARFKVRGKRRMIVRAHEKVPVNVVSRLDRSVTAPRLKLFIGHLGGDPARSREVAARVKCKLRL
jgi:hypothetical protein